MKKTAQILRASSPSHSFNFSYSINASLLPPPPSSTYPVRTNPIVIVISFLASAFVLACYFTIIAREYCSRRRSTVLTNSTHEDQDQSPNPTLIRYVSRSEGLEQSLISSITTFKYKRGNSPVEGTECSICLNEFCDDEELRVLPNCTHGFHLFCIDTWLESNVNCPLCRTEVVSAPMGSPSREPSSSSCDSEEDETNVRNSQGGCRNDRCVSSTGYAFALGEPSSASVDCGVCLQNDLGVVEIMMSIDDVQLDRVSVSADDSSAPATNSKEDPSN